MTTVIPPVFIYDQQRLFTTWNITDIYNATTNPTAKYLPNVDDLVIDYNAGFFRVTGVDITTGNVVMEPWSPPPNATAGDDVDILLGSGPGTQYESWRVWLDTSVLPYALQCDSRIHLYGTTVSYIKVFLGTNIGQSGTVISQWYDTGGNFLGENIPTELVVMPDANNVGVQTPKVGYTLSQLQDNEQVTVVSYRADGGATSTARCLIINSSFVRTTDASQKTIVSIALETPFLSGSDPTLIVYPINMPVIDLNLIGVVTYSDGTQLRMPVDGTKFSVSGLQYFVSSIQGQVVPLVLKYLLSPGEFTDLATGGTSAKFITTKYYATTGAENGAYSLKIFGYPIWQDAISGYRMDYWLYTLDRDEVYNITSYVTQAPNTTAFNGLLYGTVQNLGVAVNLSQVDPKFANTRHVQSIAVDLLAPGPTHQTDWILQFTPGQNPAYGSNVEAVLTMTNQNLWTLDLSSGYASLQTWLQALYYNTVPLYSAVSETAPPAPNFFAVIVGGQRIEVPISEWNTPLTIPGGVLEGQLVYLQFFLRNSQTDLQLAIAGMNVHYVASTGTAPTPSPTPSPSPSPTPAPVPTPTPAPAPALPVSGELFFQPTNWTDSNGQTPTGYWSGSAGAYLMTIPKGANPTPITLNLRPDRTPVIGSSSVGFVMSTVANSSMQCLVEVLINGETVWSQVPQVGQIYPFGDINLSNPSYPSVQSIVVRVTPVNWDNTQPIDIVLTPNPT